MADLARSLIVALLLTGGAAKDPPPCSVSAQPKLSIAPLRFMRVRTVVEPNPSWFRADLYLIDADGFEERSSQLWERNGQWDPPRTTVVEWPSVDLGPGEYRVVLTVGDRFGRGCRADDRIEVE